MKLDRMTVIVIGAGVAGLTASQALAARGAAVTVLEQADAIREVGAGLQISPNGFAVLGALGLGDALRACSLRAAAVRLCDYRGQSVLRLDLGRLASRDYYFVHRADLIELLERGARSAGVDILLNQEVVEVSSDDLPAVRTEAGDTRQADLVIGADGLHSVVRQALNGTLAPWFTRQVAWRALVPNDAGREPEARVHMGPRRHLVSYPLRDGALLNLVAVEERAAWQAESWSQTGDPAMLRAKFIDFGPEVQAMLADVTEVGVWGLFRHPVAKTWQGEGLAILGDAAHPTLPFLAQGANLALEDAWVLADALSGDGPLPERLAAYQARRAARAAAVVEAASKNAWKYHLSFPPLRLAAHVALRLGGALAPERMMRQFDWIYELDVTREAGPNSL